MTDEKNTGKIVELTKEELKTKVEVCIPKQLKENGWNASMYYLALRDQMGKDKQQNHRPSEDIIKFAYVAWRSGLDPLVNQIYAVYRWSSSLGRENMTIQTGIDGMRLVAQRTGDYAGQDDVVYTPIDESTKNPIKASCTVYKMVQGTRVPFTATARWSEYAQINSKTQQPEFMWGKMPYLMLGKCAEALALRKAFPNELSGIYTDEEMNQATNNVLDGISAPTTMNNKPKIEVIHGAENEGQIHTSPQPSVPGEPPIVGSPEAAVVSDEKSKADAKPTESVPVKEVTIDKMQEQIVAMRERNKQEREKQPEQQAIADVAPEKK